MEAVRAALPVHGRACGDCLEQALCFITDRLGRRVFVMLALAGAPHQMRQAGVEVAGGNRAVKSSAIPELNSPGNGYRSWTGVIVRDRAFNPQRWQQTNR
jgi:hypothetical protein